MMHQTKKTTISPHLIIWKNIYLRWNRSKIRFRALLFFVILVMPNKCMEKRKKLEGGQSLAWADNKVGTICWIDFNINLRGTFRSHLPLEIDGMWSADSLKPEGSSISKTLQGNKDGQKKNPST